MLYDMLKDSLAIKISYINYYSSEVMNMYIVYGCLSATQSVDNSNGIQYDHDAKSVLTI